MTAEITYPTLSDLQNKWDADFKSNYRRHLKMAAVAAVLYMPLCLWWFHSIVGWPLTIVSALAQLVAIPLIARIPAKLGVGPRPTQQTYEENRQIRETIQRREARLAAGKDNTVEVSLTDPF